MAAERRNTKTAMASFTIKTNIANMQLKKAPASDLESWGRFSAQGSPRLYMLGRGGGRGRAERRAQKPVRTLRASAVIFGKARGRACGRSQVCRRSAVARSTCRAPPDPRSLPIRRRPGPRGMPLGSGVYLISSSIISTHPMHSHRRALHS